MLSKSEKRRNISSFSSFIGNFSGIFVSLLAINLSAVDVPLTVRETAGVARIQDPCRSGIPMIPGALHNLDNLCLVDEQGKVVPAQFRVINRRPAGDIEWVCVDFLADVGANGVATYRLTDQVKDKIKIVGPVSLKDGKKELTVTNGKKLKLVIPKNVFAGLGEVWQDKTLISKGGALTIKGVDGKTYRSTSDLTAPLSVQVEESGPIHAVIRIDGEMRLQSADGKDHLYPRYDREARKVNLEGTRVANKDGSVGFTVRIHVWQGQDSVRTFVTLRNLNGVTADWNDSKFQFGDYWAGAITKDGNYLVDGVDLDLDLNFFGKLSYRVGGGIEGSEEHKGEIEQPSGSVVLHQDSSASWMWQAATGRIFDERLKRNHEILKDIAAEEAKAKGAEVEAARASAKPYYEFNSYLLDELSIKRDGFSFMGYRLYNNVPELTPASYSSFADLGKEKAEGMRAPGWISVSDGKWSVMAGCRWFWQMCPKSLEVRAPGKISVGLWSQYFSRGHVFEGKIHKTHELVFNFTPAGDKENPQADFAAFSERLVATPDARHNLASRVYGDFMLPNPAEWPRYEKSALCAVEFGVDPTLNPGMASSMEIEREKMDNYDVWRFGDSNKESWHHFGQYQELDVPYCLMIHYARTGDLRFLRFAEEIGRMLLDIPAHGGGYGHQQGESSHYYAFGPLLYANVAGESFLRDSVKYAQVNTPLRVWHLRSFAIVLWSNWATYGGFEELRPKSKAEIDTALAWWGEKQQPNGSVAGWDRSWQVFFLGLGSDALGRYAETFPEDKTSRERLVGVMKEWMEHLEKLPDDTRNKLMDKTCANGFAYASRFSGNPTFLDFAAKNLVSDDKFFIHYRTGQCSAKNWSETQAAQRLIQVFMHDIDKQRHPERYK